VTTPEQTPAAGEVDVRELARRIVAGSAIITAVKAETDAARAELLAYMRRTGTERVRAYGDDAVDYGPVTYCAGAVTARVADEAALLRHVREHHPSELTQVVRPAYVTKLLADAVAGMPVPGVVVEAGTPYVSAKPTGAARSRAADLIAGSTLNLPPEPPPPLST